MKVLAAKGARCPKEDKPREYITDTEPVDVPDDSTYYRRLIADGSLVLVQQSNGQERIESSSVIPAASGISQKDSEQVGMTKKGGKG